MDDAASRLLQAVVSGVLLGGVYALPAVGLSLIWGVMKVVNIAHGVLALLGSYLALVTFQAFGLDPLVALVAVVPGFFLLGLLLQRTLVQPLAQAPEMSSLLAVLFLDQMLTRTYLGKAIRATAQNRSAALLAGINADRMALVAFGIGTALAGVAGVALALIYSFYPTVHIFWVVKAFLIVVLGGVGNVRGTLVAAFLLGLAESLFGTFVSFRWVDFSVYVLLLVILLVRPQGLYGRYA